MTVAPWRVWVLGSGTALPSAARDNTFLALETGSGGWLIDCGGSPYRRLLQAGLDPLALQGIILTHSHADHLYGLPALLFQLALAGRGVALPIYGLAETLRVARQVVAAFELGEHCVAHEWRPVDASGDISNPCGADGGGSLRVQPVSHSRPAVGVRVAAPNGVVLAYSGDTQPCPGITDLARGAHWLLHECTVPATLAGHSTPQDIARTALEAGVERVGIVHYDPRYVMPVAELRTQMVRAGFRGKVRIFGEMDAVQLAE